MPKHLMTKLNIPESALLHVSTPYNRFIPTISQNYCDIVNIVHFAPLLNMRRCIVWYYWVWCWRYIYLHTCIFLLFKQLTAELKNLSLVSNKYTGYGFDPIVRHNYISSWNVRLLSYVLCMWTSTEWLKHEESIFKKFTGFNYAWGYNKYNHFRCMISFANNGSGFDFIVEKCNTTH